MPVSSTPQVLTACHVPSTGPREVTGELAPDARFPIGSIAKTIAALTAARLAVHGAVDWDAVVTGEGARPITLRQLLLHTAALPFELLPRHWFGPPLTEEELQGAFSAPPRIPVPPGTWHYSNLGYAMVAAALSRATGAPYAELAREWVLDPLGMGSTSYPDPALEGPTRLGAAAPAGDLWSTLTDLIALGSALDGARTDVVGDRELGMLVDHGTAIPDGTVWGAGIRTFPAGPHRVLFASGTMGDRTTGLVVWPRRGLTIFVAERGFDHDALRDAGIEHWRRPDELRTWWWDGQEVVESRFGDEVELTLRETTWPAPLFSGREAHGLLRGVDAHGHPLELTRQEASIIGPGIHLTVGVESSAFGQP